MIYILYIFIRINAATKQHKNKAYKAYTLSYKLSNYKIKALQVIKVKLSQTAKRQAPNL